MFISISRCANDMYVIYVIRMTEKDKNFYSDNISVESLEYGYQATHFMSHGHISEQYLINKFYYHKFMMQFQQRLLQCQLQQDTHQFNQSNVSCENIAPY